MQGKKHATLINAHKFEISQFESLSIRRIYLNMKSKVQNYEKYEDISHNVGFARSFFIGWNVIRLKIMHYMSLDKTEYLLRPGWNVL